MSMEGMTVPLANLVGSFKTCNHVKTVAPARAIISGK